ncbi:hypothetical protein JW824_00120 [bacterium]|nr:hypothetical protein [bacterium]
MTVIFTKEFIDSMDKPVGLFERSYIRYLATNPNLKHLRDELEKIISIYPNEKQNGMIKCIRSFDDSQCKSHIAELRVYGILNSNFEDVQIEVPLEIVDNKTPDFWVDGTIAFEVATPFETKNVHELEIIECISRIESKTKAIIQIIGNIPNDENPKLSEIKQGFIHILNEKENLTRPENFEYVSPSQNIYIAGRLWPGVQKSSSVVGVFDSYEFNEKNDQDYKELVRKIIKRKLKKYKKLADQEFPLVLVIYNDIDWLDEIELDEIVNGDRCFAVNGNTLHMFRSSNMIIHPNRNRGLSAVLVRDYTTLDEYYLIKNPNALVPLGDFEEVVKIAFKTKELEIKEIQ